MSGARPAAPPSASSTSRPATSLLAAFDPDVVVRSNGTEAVRGAAAVAGRALPFTQIAQVAIDLIDDPHRIAEADLAILGR